MVVAGSLELVAAVAIIAATATFISSRSTDQEDQQEEATDEMPKPHKSKFAQHLIGEELVNETTVYEFADRMIEEADRIWASPADQWRPISTNHGVVNQGTRVSGLFARAGVELTRSSAVVAAPADKLFELLASPAGYQLIDPFTDPKDHEKPPIQSFDATKWQPANGSGPESGAAPPRRLEAANAIAKIPLITTREFIVLNVIDYNTRYFLSKSIQHSSVPGTSAFGPDGYVPPANGNVRALNTFGVQIEPLASDPHRQCVVKMINFADLGGKFPVALTNLGNKNFLVDVVRRMRKTMVENNKNC